jgi:hypothetical protein
LPPRIKAKKRANSTLTVDQEKLLSFALDQGGKPAGIRVALTKQKMEELQSAGVDPLLLKDPMGGLIGVLHTMMATKHSPNPRDTYPACIPHVSCMDPECIWIVS